MVIFLFDINSTFADYFGSHTDLLSFILLEVYDHNILIKYFNKFLAFILDRIDISII